ncbi:MAG: hypothetical protein V1753_04175 [Pseudomonadota bacterium]
MQPKQYTGRTIQEAIEQVKKDLGVDAMILDTRRIPIGSVGTLGRDGDRFIVTAVTGRGDTNEVVLSRSISEEAVYPEKSMAAELATIKEMLCFMNKSWGFWERARMHPGLISLYGMLVRKGIEESFVQGFFERAGILEDQALHADAALLREKTMKEILKSISISDPFKDSSQKQIAAFIGPTGVGKTTTIAKLAARFCLQQKRSVGLISIDNYRVAALEQIRTYARILGIPCLPAFNEKDLNLALTQFSDKSIVLIDTAGRSHYDKKYIHGLNTLFSSDMNIQKHLVLSVSTNEQEMGAAVENFNELGISSYIFTKVDEAKIRGGMVNQVMRKNLPISFIADGQRVPEDIKAASQIGVLKLLMVS